MSESEEQRHESECGKIAIGFACVRQAFYDGFCFYELDSCWRCLHAHFSVRSFPFFLAKMLADNAGCLLYCFANGWCGQRCVYTYIYAVQSLADLFWFSFPHLVGVINTIRGEIRVFNRLFRRQISTHTYTRGQVKRRCVQVRNGICAKNESAHFVSALSVRRRNSEDNQITANMQ